MVKGIGDYGNCFGVPTVSGEVYFEECYQDNPLVNAMAVGIVKHTQTATATAMGTGNPVFIVGSSTGKDGIHGATFASEEISEKSEAKRPSVQVGDPFTEKLLVEATLEAIQSGAVVGIQDMGAAGITCSTSEMSAKGKCGMKINLDNVPLRDDSMTAYEIMLSESQERMLVVVEKGKEKEAIDIFEKWDLNCVQIGEVIDEDRVKVFHKGQLEADVPADDLVLGGGAPVYIREQKEPEYLLQTREFDQNSIPEPDDCNEILLKLLSSPNIANKTWVYRQYDYEVRTNTVIDPGGDASVIRLKGTNKALAMKVDCNSKFVYLNPYTGGASAVAECARNVVCTGGKPLGITNCLNFGNPYDPEVYYQFAEAIRGIGAACLKFETPVTGGNVSFYNESQDFAVYPTPTIGIIGLIDDVNKMMTSHFKDEGDVILLIGRQNSDEIGGSEYLNYIHHKVTGDSPALDLDFEKALQDCTLELIDKQLIKSAHDTSEGGLAVAITEACIMNKDKMIGCKVNIDYQNRKDFELFGETQSRIIISADKEKQDEIISICEKHNVPVNLIGTVGGDSVKINEDVSVSLNDGSQKYYKMFDELMQS